MTFLIIGWNALFRYAFCHPALLFFYRVEQSADSLWDAFFHHFVLVTAINLGVLTLLWCFALKLKTHRPA
ncbi:MAG: hypothetical protein NTY53_21025 [Kiritimatiellaeota bacterium]|nr:hypothetical protein [Kiritimatiellota bacterium]